MNTDEETGVGVLLKEAWERYQSPMALTEVHLHCHREEQLRWYQYILRTATTLKEKGINILAITSWALLGSYGWNNILREPGGEYEPGAFDLRGGDLRPTALAKYIAKNAVNHIAHQHLSIEKGWWQREDRLLYYKDNCKVKRIPSSTAPVLIIGKNGTLGKAFARVCQDRFINHSLLSRQDCDISRVEDIDAIIDRFKPWAIINAAGFVRVDDAEREIDACFRDNSTGPKNLALACHRQGIQLVNFSSDLVFDGTKPSPYLENDLPNPLNIYGQSKKQSEEILQKTCPSSLIIRTSAFFSPWDEFNFAYFIQNKLVQKEPVKIANDLFVSPTYVPHLVNATLDILIDGENDIWHLANKGAISWSEWGYLVADRLRLDRSLIQPLKASEIGFEARRPRNSVLGSHKGNLLSTFESALEEYFENSRFDNRKVA
jgi:dTDP-4-dehydrorhamnose reductase